MQDAIRALAPRDDAQRDLRAQALALAEESSANRWLLVLQRHTSVSMPMVVVVVAWLALIFVGFGLFAPTNGTVFTALLLCATSVAGAMFLILEMDDPVRRHRPAVRRPDAPGARDPGRRLTSSRTGRRRRVAARSCIAARGDARVPTAALQCRSWCRRPATPPAVDPSPIALTLLQLILGFARRHWRAYASAGVDARGASRC